MTTSDPSAVPKKGRRLRHLLSPRSALRSSTWEAPPPSYKAVETEAALPEHVVPETGDAWLVPSFELAEQLIARGAPSARIAIDRQGDERAWIEALVAAAPVDPILPPKPHRFAWRMCVILPTYNEVENLEDIVAAIGRHLDTEVLVVDDDSPDGTGQLADRLAAENDRLHVLHRAHKEGIGPAYVAGFRWALARGYDRVFEMDSDFSHAPWDLPRLAAASAHADLVIGSRYVKGGNTIGWKLPRRLLSRGANLYTRLFLGFRVHDWTAGFRCYKAETLARLDLERIAASGYSFQIEMTYRLLAAGGVVREVPIGFTDRSQGKSKMTRGIALEAVRLVPTLRWKA